jgi:uncharacterized protein YbjQ (UPF0145 family)
VYEARRLAVDRLAAEGLALGASGVVGVDLTRWLADPDRTLSHSEITVHLLGTAVRHRTEDGHRPAHGRPFTSDLSGQDFWTLRRAGARPVGLVLGSCVYSVASFTTMGWRMWRNLELPHFTQALYDARELAMTRMQKEARAIGATGIVGVQLTEHQHGWGGRAIEFLALGTAITRDAGPTGTAGAVATPVIDLSDNLKRD